MRTRFIGEISLIVDREPSLSGWHVTYLNSFCLMGVVSNLITRTKSSFLCAVSASWALFGGTL